MNQLAEQYARRLILIHEGLKMCAYRDSKGFPTVGIGHLLTREERRKWPVGTRVPRLACIEMFHRDFANHAPIGYAFASVCPDLDAPRMAVILDMAFNMGRKGLFAFQDMRAVLSRRDWKGVFAEMADSKWAGEVKTRFWDPRPEVKTDLGEIMLTGALPGDVKWELEI